MGSFRRLLVTLVGFAPLLARALSISIAAEPAVAAHPITFNAISDVRQLLNEACGCVDLAHESESVSIRLLPPTEPNNPRSHFRQGRLYPYFDYPEHGFTWRQEGSPGAYRLTLSSASFQGLANGLYALLQEQLGFQFVHPRQTILPLILHWPLIGEWTWTGQPRFDKKGFHLHTMHPTELTEALHDPHFPGGKAMVQEYLLWLARNGQNYFDFSLMQGVDKHLEEWVAYISTLTQFAHDRGILCGIDLSLHMLQQHSFQLVQFAPQDFRPYERQVRHRLRLLMRANWDFINLEFALAEFVGGMENLRDRLRDAVIAELEHYPRTKLVGRQHVVKPEAELGGSHGHGSLNIPDDPRMGLLVHTVMCYALTDKRVPVYQLSDFSHLHQLLQEQNKVRETWYYPESAYWITFDNSIPLLLLPYLRARLQDIETCADMGIPGHVTFSSGWEWGYWAVDWSIARWCWDYSFTPTAQDSVAPPVPSRSPLQYIKPLFGDANNARWLQQIADLQQEWLIDGDLLRWLCPSNPTDELPSPMNKQFQPRGFANLGDLRKVAEQQPARLLELPIDSLKQFAATCMTKAQSLKLGLTFLNSPFKMPLKLADEIADALFITGLRARHSAELMEAVIAYAGNNQSMATLRAGLARAATTRAEALTIVRRQEKRYRYPVEQLAGLHSSFTAYDYGYLYPVHDLHFWQREEQQILKGRHGPFFMNIYDLMQIAGLRK